MENKSRVTENQYLEMISLKTGSLARMSMRMASIVAGKNKEEEKKIGELGVKLGTAFQIRDDVLDILNVKEEIDTGKEVGNDFREGKVTLPLIHALNNLEEKDKNYLLYLYGTDLDKDGVQDVYDLLRKKNSVKYAKKRAREIIEDAWDDFSDVVSESETRAELKGFVDFLVERLK